MNLYIEAFDTPYGNMIIAVEEGGAVTRLIFPNGHAEWQAEVEKHQYEVQAGGTRCQPALDQLTDYFSGKRQRFDLTLNPAGTAFQKSVWVALCAIPFGTTTTYKELAENIGNPAAVRAVGAANGANPIPIIVPCHRVIGTGGALTGFGGGLPLKKSLLAFEGVEMRERVGRGAQLSLFEND